MHGGDAGDTIDVHNGDGGEEVEVEGEEVDLLLGLHDGEVYEVLDNGKYQLNLNECLLINFP